jgi:hypothetical protein
LRNYPQVIFERKDLANAHTVNSLGIRKNYADGARLCHCIKGFGFGVIV